MRIAFVANHSVQQLGQIMTVKLSGDTPVISSVDISVCRRDKDNTWKHCFWWTELSDDNTVWYVKFTVRDATIYVLKGTYHEAHIIGSPMELNFRALCPKNAISLTSLQVALDNVDKENQAPGTFCMLSTGSDLASPAVLSDRAIGTLQLRPLLKLDKKFTYPLGICITDFSTIFICDARAERVKEFDVDSNILSVIHVDSFRNPSSCVHLVREGREILFIKDDFTIHAFSRPSTFLENSKLKAMDPLLVWKEDTPLLTTTKVNLYGFTLAETAKGLFVMTLRKDQLCRINISPGSEFGHVEWLPFGPVVEAPLKEAKMQKCRFIHFHSGVQRLYVSDLGLNKVYVCDAKGNSIAELPGNWKMPAGITNVPDGRLIVADCRLKSVLLYSSEGKLIGPLNTGKASGSHSGVCYNSKLGLMGLLNLGGFDRTCAHVFKVLVESGRQN